MSLAPRYPVRTDRLLLRPFEDADLDAFHAMRDDAEHTRCVPYGPAPKAQVAKALAQRKAWTALGAPESAITLAVVERDGGAFVGELLLFHHDPVRACAELGFAFDTAHHGRGYATEASRALVAWALGDGGLRRLHARCVARNRASIRVLEKLGFREEGRLREEVLVDGTWADTVVYGLLRSEWRG